MSARLKGEFGRLQFYAIGLLDAGREITSLMIAESMRVTDSAGRHALQRLTELRLARVVRTVRPQSGRGGEVKVYGAMPTVRVVAATYRDVIEKVTRCAQPLRPPPVVEPPVVSDKREGSGVIAGRKLIRGYVYPGARF